MNVEEIRREARHLPRRKQGELIARLLEDFGSSDYDVSDAEVSQRVRETGNGEVADISHDELLSGLHFLAAIGAARDDVKSGKVIAHAEVSDLLASSNHAS